MSMSRVERVQISSSSEQLSVRVGVALGSSASPTYFTIILVICATAEAHSISVLPKAEPDRLAVQISEAIIRYLTCILDIKRHEFMVARPMNRGRIFSIKSFLRQTQSWCEVLKCCQKVLYF